MPDVIRARVSHSIELAEDSIIIHETERDNLTGLFNKEFFFEYGIHDLVLRTGGLACRSGSNTFGIYIPHLENLTEELSECV